MECIKFYYKLKEKDIHLALEQGKLVIDAPRDVLNNTIIRDIRDREDDLVNLLTILNNEIAELTRLDQIAIIGLSCSFPGQSNSAESFYGLLHEGDTGITEIPKCRWDIDDYYDPDPDKIGKIYTKCGGFIDNPDLFDAGFYSISPRHAVAMDPQCRLLLETSTQALEHSGINLKKIKGSKTGVYVGAMWQDYAELQAHQGSGEQSTAGGGLSSLSGYLSYFYGLEGPTMTVDTACSSSLVSVHLACQGLRNQECNLAMAAGVNLILSPRSYEVECRAKMLSPDGQCKTFDESANGFARGEGVGVVILKRLEDALKDGDSILAVIRGSATNHDGATSGYSVPNGQSQQAVIKDALQDARVSSDKVSCVEAHGTGTELGDPIELSALQAVYGTSRSKENALWISSVKTNVGHCEGAAGIAGLIKAVLQLQSDTIFPHRNVKKLTSKVNWDDINLRVPLASVPWPKYSDKKTMGVSSFGFSGTNAHVIVEEAPIFPEPETSGYIRPMHILPLSAKTEKALSDQISNYLKHLQEKDDQTIEDVCYTAGVGRAHFNYRAADFRF